MFGNLLKEKFELEERVRKLHNTYIALRKQSIIENNPTDDSKKNLNQLLEKKENYLKKIKQQYTEIFSAYEELTNLLRDSRQTALDLEEHIQLVADRLNIQFPEELKRNPIAKKSVIPVPEIQINDNQLYDNNKQLITEEDSDKENSTSDLTPQGNEDYFSPQIQIRKSLITDDKLYTPAIKSHSKSKIPHLK